METKSISKHIKVLSLFIKMSLMSLIEYRINFTIGILVELAYLSAKLLYLFAVYNSGVSINGLSPDYITLYIGIFTIITALYNGFFMDNVFNIPSLIRTGGLDLLLIKPISLQMHISLKNTNFSMLITNFISGSLMICLSISRLNLNVSLFKFLQFGFFVGIGVYVAYLINMIFITFSFWTLESRGLIEMIDKGWDMNSMPRLIYSTEIQRFFSHLIPIFLVTNLPMELLMNKLDNYTLLYCLLTIGALRFVKDRFFKFGLSKYCSANM